MARVIEHVITEYGDPSIDGHGGLVVAEDDVDCDGALHDWATSDRELLLQTDGELRYLVRQDPKTGCW